MLFTDYVALRVFSQTRSLRLYHFPALNTDAIRMRVHYIHWLRWYYGCVLWALATIPTSLYLRSTKFSVSICSYINLNALDAFLFLLSSFSRFPPKMPPPSGRRRLTKNYSQSPWAYPYFLPFEIVWIERNKVNAPSIPKYDKTIEWRLQQCLKVPYIHETKSIRLLSFYVTCTGWHIENAALFSQAF